MISWGMSVASEPTELEGCVLGVVWEMGPCTAYTIRRVFLDSPSPHWTGSAGAIYPLVDRLARRGLLEPGPKNAGPRTGRTFVLTPAGRRALSRWVAPPWPDWAVGVPVDPLRTRLSFLGSLPPAGRRAFLAQAEAKLRVHIRQVHADYLLKQQRGELYERLVSRGALMMLRARLKWLREVRDELTSSTR